MKALFALLAVFAAACFLLAAFEFVTEEPAAVPADATNVRSGWAGTCYDQEVSR